MMEQTKTQYVFGPVPSRRLGRSLGVDLVPFKTCTLDCIYCQLGRTTVLTSVRKAYRSPQIIIDELRSALAEGASPDYITLSGSGEPTLCLGLDRIIGGIKEATDIPVVVLTNGSLLSDVAVQRELQEADLVIPSLDAGDDSLFRYINRPCDGITHERLVEGLCAFRRCFPKPIWLEVFLLAGVNCIESDVRRIAECVSRIQPDKVQFNTVARPPAEEYAMAATAAQMRKYAGLFDCPVEIIAEATAASDDPKMRVSREDVWGLLRRRPCTAGDIASGLGMHRNEALKYVGELIKEGIVRTIIRDGSAFYAAYGEPE